MKEFVVDHERIPGGAKSLHDRALKCDSHVDAQHLRAVTAMYALDRVLRETSIIEAYPLDKGELDRKNYNLDIEIDGFPFRLKLEAAE